MSLITNPFGFLSINAIHFAAEFFIKSVLCILLIVVIEACFLRKRPLLADSCWRGVTLLLAVLPVVIIWGPHLALIPQLALFRTVEMQESPVAVFTTDYAIDQIGEAGEINSDSPPIAMQVPAADFSHLSPRSADASGWRAILLLVWFAGSLHFMIRLFLSWWDLRRIHRRATTELSSHWYACKEILAELGIQQEVQLLTSPDVSVPMTYGVRFPVILIPARESHSSDQKMIKAILTHELIHIARKDYCFLILTRLLRCLWWWHPGFWLMQRRLETSAELICDACTAARMNTNEDYVDVVLNQVRGLTTQPASNCTIAMSAFRLQYRLRKLRVTRLTQFASIPRMQVAISGLFLIVAFAAGIIGWKSDQTADASESSIAIRNFESPVSTSKTNVFQTVKSRGVLAGQVVDAKGRPVVGALVDASTWCIGDETLTDKNGRFFLSGFAEGRPVQMEISHPDFAPHLIEAQSVDEPNWQVEINSGNVLSGKVLAPDGSPVADVEVHAVRLSFAPGFNEKIEVTTTSTSDESGNYKLMLEPARYEIRARVSDVGACRIPGVVIQKDNNINLDVQLARQARFEAKLIDVSSGRPVSGIEFTSRELPGTSAVSDANGRVELSEIPIGKYKFWLRGTDETRVENGTANGYGRWWSAETSDPYHRQQRVPGEFQRNCDYMEFDVTENMSPVSIQFESAAQVSGQLLDPEGNPVANGTVTAAKTGTGNSLTGDGRYSYRTDGQGRFLLYLPASHDLKNNLVGHDGKYDEWRNWSNGVGQPFQTRPGEKIENQIIQLTRPATVRGRVVDEQGAPQAKVYVTASPQDLLHNRYYVPHTETGEDGRFELRFLRPGNHWLQANSNYANGNDAPPGRLKTIELQASETVEEVTIVKAP